MIFVGGKAKKVKAKNGKAKKTLCYDEEEISCIVCM